LWARSSARQFNLGNAELVALARLDDKLAPLPFSDGARNRAPKMTVLQSIEDHLLKTGESLANLPAARTAGVILVCSLVNVISFRSI